MSELYARVIKFNGIAPVEPATDDDGKRTSIGDLAVKDLVQLRVVRAQPRWVMYGIGMPEPTEFETWFDQQTAPVTATMSSVEVCQLQQTEEWENGYYRYRAVTKSSIYLAGMAIFPSFDTGHEIAVSVESMKLHAPRFYELQDGENEAVFTESPLAIELPLL